MTVLTTVGRRDAHAGVVADHLSGEVPERARRRTFTAAYKLRIVEEYENAEPVLAVRCCGVRGCTRRI